jgi:site-specific recombinase
MKSKVYIETSIVSYLTARPSRDMVTLVHQQITEKWWQTERENYELVISELVVLEAGAGDEQMARKRLRFLKDMTLLEAKVEAEKLTEKIVKSRILPEKAAADASHIAIATTHELDYLLTWNCKHIANAKIFPEIFEIIKDAGYKPPVICTPEGLLGDTI